jgi:hypothetical protein
MNTGKCDLCGSETIIFGILEDEDNVPGGQGKGYGQLLIRLYEICTSDEKHPFRFIDDVYLEAVFYAANYPSTGEEEERFLHSIAKSVMNVSKNHISPQVLAEPVCVLKAEYETMAEWPDDYRYKAIWKDRTCKITDEFLDEFLNRPMDEFN